MWVGRKSQGAWSAYRIDQWDLHMCKHISYMTMTGHRFGVPLP